MSKNDSKPKWWVHKDKVRTDYPVIENLSQWLITDVPYINPEHPEYIKFWSRETKRCIEGKWGKEWGGYRYMPGNLYFFGNYGIIKHTWQENGVNVTKFTKPTIMDYVWEFAYMSYVAYGFSGFERDEKYTCNLKAKLYKEGKTLLKYVPKECFNGEELKEYKDPYKYISELKDSNLGKPLFQNEAMDVMVMGSRRGGKSYWVAIGELEYNFVFSGSRRYNEAFLNKEYNCAQCAGSADTDKSSDLLNKFKESQDAKTNTDNKDFIKWFGLWEEDGYDDKGKPTTHITPCPFYKRSMGNLNCPNKKTPYSSRYKIQINGQYVPKGDGNEVFHVNYSEKKGTGSQAAVGNTYLFSDVEENGLVSNVLEIKSANDAATKRGVKIGVQWFQGTSGNIDYVQASKKMFLNPQDYGFVSFKNEFSFQGKNQRVCYFIPKYVILPEYKDKNGNTDYDAAINFVNHERQEKADSAEPAVLSRLIMNEPNYVEEMWITDKGYYLPYEEASVRHSELTLHQHYKDLMTSVELIWDKNTSDGVKYNVLHDVEPITEYPLPKNLKDPSGCVVIYEFPQMINGTIPQDMYCFVGHDPYVEEAIDRGGSLGVTYILKNPKYIPFGYTGNIIVASYIGKPVKGIEYYYEQQEKLLQFFGNPQQGLWYEKNRGDNCRAFYTSKNKLHLLAPTPQYQQGSHMFQRHIQSFGYLVSSNKRILINMLKDWLLEETEFMLNGQSEKLLNIQRIPCLFLINQIMQYNEEPGSNFDAIMGFLGCILGLREYQSRQNQEINNKPQINRFKSILENNSIFKQNDKTIPRSKRRQLV